MKYLNIKKALAAWQELQPLSDTDRERQNRRFTVADTQLPRFSSIQSLISRIQVPKAYMLMIFSAMPSASMVSRLNLIL